MPTYDYLCTKCEAVSQVLQEISDAPLQACPHCGQAALMRKSNTKASSFKSPTHDGTYTHCACGKASHCHASALPIRN